MVDKITPFLWFDGQAEEAAEFYASLFEDSRITGVRRYTEAGPGEPGSVMTVEFELAGRTYCALNGGPHFKFNEAVSLAISCRDQNEVDHYWALLTGDGGEAGPCGWCKDRYGLSWQVVPEEMTALFSDPDPQRAQRAMAAMLQMGKLDIGAMRRAADGAADGAAAA